MNKNELQSLFFAEVKPYFIEKGFKFRNSHGDPAFYRKTESLSVFLGFNFKTAPSVSISRYTISHFVVEDIILEIGLPNMDLSVYKQKKDRFLDTVIDKKGKLNHDENMIFQNENQVTEAVKTLKTYLESDGEYFIKQYSALPNILNEMDRLQSEGKDWNEILGGMGDRLFRGLIISKLCNDPKFEEKVKFCDGKFYNVPLLKNWQPYYERLKEKLASIPS